MNVSRRSLLIGLGAGLICAPAIVRASSLMKVKPAQPAFGEVMVHLGNFNGMWVSKRMRAGAPIWTGDVICITDDVAYPAYIGTQHFDAIAITGNQCIRLPRDKEISPTHLTPKRIISRIGLDRIKG